MLGFRGGSRGVFGVPNCAYSKTSASNNYSNRRINLLYFKAPEPARLCLGIHIKNNALAHRAFFITKRLVKLLTWNQLATVMDTRYKRR